MKELIRIFFLKSQYLYIHNQAKRYPITRSCNGLIIFFYISYPVIHLFYIRCPVHWRNGKTFILLKFECKLLSFCFQCLLMYIKLMMRCFNFFLLMHSTQISFQDFANKTVAIGLNDIRVWKVDNRNENENLPDSEETL